MGTTLAGNTQKTKEFLTEEKLTKNTRNNKVYAQPIQEIQKKHGIRDRKKKLRKNTRNNKVYAQPIQEIQRKLRLFDRSQKPGQTKNAAPRGDLCSGFKFIYDKKFGPLGAFLRPGGSKNAKNQKTSKAEPRKHQTDFIRLVSAKLMRRGGSCRPGRPF